MCPTNSRFLILVVQVLAFSRIMVAWLPVGMAMGAYDMAARYLQERQQFGSPLASFQLMQEKLVRMLGNIQVGWGGRG